jgi:hypothetical protein
MPSPQPETPQTFTQDGTFRLTPEQHLAEAELILSLAGQPGAPDQANGRSRWRAITARWRGDPGARDAAWRELAATQPDVADAGLLEASRAADKLPEQVVTKLDERVTAAEKADAFAKQMYDMFGPAARRKSGSGSTI